MKNLKITPELSEQFKAKYKSSSEPIFMISGRGEVTYGCKVIERTENAVFIYVSSFLWCGGFWMPVETYNTLNNGFVVEKLPENRINYNNTIYRY